MRRQFRILTTTLGVVLAIWLAVWWRESAWTLIPTESLANWLFGTNKPWSLIAGLFNLTLVIVVFFVVRFWLRVGWFHLRNRRHTTSVSANSLLISDSPLVSAENDALSRSDFVQSVAVLLQPTPSSDSTVVAVTGTWGEGKTSVLRLVVEHLRRRPSPPIIVEFDPWPEDSKRGVVARLLDTIASAISNAPNVHPGVRADTTRTLRALADAVAHDLGLSYRTALHSAFRWLNGGLTEIASDALHSLSADRELLARVLKRLPQGLVVMVDDLDRVDAEELRATLMAVHALTRLPNTNFLLAYDPSVVDKLLESLSFGGTDRPFREKIIHVSIPLPTTAFVDRLRLFQGYINKTVSNKGALEHWQFWNAAHRAQVETVVVRIGRSPRSLKRLANHSGVILARLHREVNGPDVILLELLRAEFPEAWGFIRNHRNELDPGDRYTEGDLPDNSWETLAETLEPERSNTSKKLPSLMQQLVQTCSVERREEFHQLIGVLFPLSRDTTSGPPNRGQLERESRVAIGRNLRKYFSMGVEGMGIADEDVRAALAEPTTREAILHDALQVGFLRGFFGLMSSHVKAGAAITDTEKFVRVALKMARAAWKERSESVAEEASEMLIEIVATLPVTERAHMLHLIVSSKESISTSEDVLLELLKIASLWSNGRLLSRQPDKSTHYDSSQLVPDDALLSKKDEWIRTAWDVGIERLFEDEPEPISILFRLGQLDGLTNEYQRVRQELKSFLSKQNNLFKFVSQFSAQSTGVSKGVDGLEKLVSDWDEFVLRVRALGEPRDAIDKIEEHQPRNAKSQE